MRIAVSTETNVGLDAPVAAHFGRCPFFTLIDLEAEQIRDIRVVPNPYFPNHEPGQVPRFIHSQGAQVMLTGGMGSRAVMFFEQFGIQPVTGAGGTVRQALEAFLQGELAGAAACHESAHDHGNEPGHGQR